MPGRPPRTISERTDRKSSALAASSRVRSAFCTATNPRTRWIRKRLWIEASTRHRACPMQPGVLAVAPPETDNGRPPGRKGSSAGQGGARFHGRKDTFLYGGCHINHPKAGIVVVSTRGPGQGSGLAQSNDGVDPHSAARGERLPNRRIKYSLFIPQCFYRMGRDRAPSGKQTCGDGTKNEQQSGRHKVMGSQIFVTHPCSQKPLNQHLNSPPPTTIPTMTLCAAIRTAIHAMCLRDAPSAIRMPNSAVLCATL